MRTQVALLVLLVAAGASAVEYEVPIDIFGEDDLYELHSSEQISDDTFNALLDLIQRGVDLNQADDKEIYALPGLTLKDSQAIVAYRKAAGQLTDAQALVAAGVLSEEKLRRIAPFLSTRPSGGAPLDASGRVRLQALTSPDDHKIPTATLEARVMTLRYLTVGVNLVLARDQVSDVRWDPTRSALSAAPPPVQVRLAKVFADWRTPNYEVLVGNFRAGFAQRLVFDNTSLYTPNGVYPDEVLYRTTDLVRDCDEAAGELRLSPCPKQATYVTPDFRYRDGLFGVAAAARQITTDAGWLQIVGFLSREVHAIYQYEIYDRDTCTDPNLDSNPACAAPSVYHRLDDPFAPTSRFTFQTLPSMWAEPLGGGNLTFFFNRRTHIGVTGYGAKPEWLTNGVHLDFQEWSKWPYGGAYGAIGGDAAWGADIVDMGVEVARSYDGTPAGGGLGAIARGTVTWPKNELELSLRYYDQNFANPYGGSIAEPDVASGQRARDEAGARLRFGGRLSPNWDLRALADLRIQPSASLPKLRVEARTDYTFAQHTQLGVYARWEDKDLRSGGFGQCYDQTFQTDENGEPIPCKGQKLDLGIVGRVELAHRFSVIGQFQSRFIDDPSYPDTFRQDLSAWLSLDWWPADDFRLYARAHYLNESVDDRTSGEESLWSTIEATYRPSRELLVRFRYDNRFFLDDRTSTQTRAPNPEHWLRVEVESKF